MWEHRKNYSSDMQYRVETQYYKNRHTLEALCELFRGIIDESYPM